MTRPAKRKAPVGTLGNPYAAILLVPRDVFRREPGRIVAAADAYRCVRVIAEDGSAITTICAQHENLR